MFQDGNRIEFRSSKKNMSNNRLYMYLLQNHWYLWSVPILEEGDKRPGNQGYHGLSQHD